MVPSEASEAAWAGFEQRQGAGSCGQRLYGSNVAATVTPAAALTPAAAVTSAAVVTPDCTPAYVLPLREGAHDVSGRLLQLGASEACDQTAARLSAADQAMLDSWWDSDDDEAPEEGPESPTANLQAANLQTANLQTANLPLDTISHLQPRGLTLAVQAVRSDTALPSVTLQTVDHSAAASVLDCRGGMVAVPRWYNGATALQIQRATWGVRRLAAQQAQGCALCRMSSPLRLSV
jgi:hypothetical protein